MATPDQKQRINNEFLSIIKAIDLIQKLPGIHNEIDQQRRMAIYELLFKMMDDNLSWEKASDTIAEFEPALNETSDKLTGTFFKAYNRFKSWEDFKLANFNQLEFRTIPGKKCIRKWGMDHSGNIYSFQEATQLQNDTLNPAWLFGCGWNCHCELMPNI